MAELQPMEDFWGEVKLEGDIVFAGKIKLEKKSVLEWGVRKGISKTTKL
jgi:hypothetical protein